MTAKIDSILAQQIVDTVKSICGQDINFIDKSGIIICSTDEKRVGTYHEIGHKVAVTGTSIEVMNNNDFAGTQRGINLPVYYNHSLLVVIGITGNPEKVRKYAILAQRLTILLVREREMDASSRNQSEKIRYVIRTLLQPQISDRQQLNLIIQELGLGLNGQKRLIMLHLNENYNPLDLHSFESAAENFFRMLGTKIYCFNYPGEFLAIVEETQFQKVHPLLQTLNIGKQSVFYAAAGQACPLYKLCNSYNTAQTVQRSLKDTALTYACFDDMSLEMVIHAMDGNMRKSFVEKTTGCLGKKERELLKAYFNLECSLNQTCIQLHMHKNTIQYQLNRIHTLCGLDPRKFREAVLLYLSLKAENHLNKEADSSE